MAEDEDVQLNATQLPCLCKHCVCQSLEQTTTSEQQQHWYGIINQGSQSKSRTRMLHSKRHGERTPCKRRYVTSPAYCRVLLNRDDGRLSLMTSAGLAQHEGRGTRAMSNRFVEEGGKKTTTIQYHHRDMRNSSSCTTKRADRSSSVQL